MWSTTRIVCVHFREFFILNMNLRITNQNIWNFEELFCKMWSGIKSQYHVPSQTILEWPSLEVFPVELGWIATLYMTGRSAAFCRCFKHEISDFRKMCYQRRVFKKKKMWKSWTTVGRFICVTGLCNCLIVLNSSLTVWSKTRIICIRFLWIFHTKSENSTSKYLKF